MLHELAIGLIIVFIVIVVFEEPRIAALPWPVFPSLNRLYIATLLLNFLLLLLINSTLLLFLRLNQRFLGLNDTLLIHSLEAVMHGQVIMLLALLLMRDREKLLLHH